MSNIESDPFREEADMQSWAQELGLDYVVGSQGSTSQPFREMSNARLSSKIGQVMQRMRELNGLASLPDEREKELHRTSAEIGEMDEGQLARWQQDVLEWLIDNPTASINNLIIDEPKE